MTNKIYLAEYYRNDGGWHEAGISLTPSYLFTAKDKEIAVELAKGYITQNRKYSCDKESAGGYEDFNLKQLLELDVKKEGLITSVSFRTIEVQWQGVPCESNLGLEKKLSEAKFRLFCLKNLLEGD